MLSRFINEENSLRKPDLIVLEAALNPVLSMRFANLLLSCCPNQKGRPEVSERP